MTVTAPSAVEASGVLFGTVHRGRTGAGSGGAHRVRAPRRWRLKNGLRMLASGELLLPLWVWLLRRCAPPGLQFMVAELRGFVTRADGTVVDYGLMGRHLVTTAGKQFLASAFDNTVEPEVLKYHGYGTGATAAAVGDTALQAELTTQYATDNTRPTGTQSHSGATYTTAGTLAPDAAVAVTEWGLFSQAASPGGTLFDRQVFSAVNLATVDSLTTSYTLTIS
ncbi:MAG TPA: hypothetical protein VGE74_31780 [Gemmata sp.]